MTTLVTKHDFRSFLGTGKPVLLDGGTGSELQRRGVNVSRGIGPDGYLGSWSSTAMGDAPAIVRQIHEDYFRVGADIVTTNSYNTNRGQLARVGLADKMEEYSRLAVELAVDARDRIAPGAFVAAAIAPMTRIPRAFYNSPPSDFDFAREEPPEHMLREWGDQTAVLAAAGAEVILIETMLSIPQAKAAVRAASQTGLPILVGVNATPEGTMHTGATLKELVAALKEEDLMIDGMLLMCMSPASISANLPKLRDAFGGPIGAYANIGYNRSTEPPEYPSRQWHVFETADTPPERYAEYGHEWLGKGCQMIGGCCGTTPEHIAALRPIVKG
jgi:S-methylmethionine-dependent homocysteine/selenocysteine methylase